MAALRFREASNPESVRIFTVGASRTDAALGAGSANHSRNSDLDISVNI
jgi:hypothetical protein